MIHNGFVSIRPCEPETLWNKVFYLAKISKMYMKHDRLNRTESEYKQTYLTTYLQKYEYLLDNCLILKMLYLSLTKQRYLNINGYTITLTHFQEVPSISVPFLLWGKGRKFETSQFCLLRFLSNSIFSSPQLNLTWWNVRSTNYWLWNYWHSFPFTSCYLFNK